MTPIRFIEDTGSYAHRTRVNAQWADLTVAIAVDLNTSGEQLTRDSAGDRYLGLTIPNGLRIGEDRLVKTAIAHGIKTADWINENVINPDGVKIEKAVLKIVDTDDTSKGLVYESETADAIVKGATAIQNLGSLHTYMRRYLYVEAYDLAVEDDLDKRSGMKQGEEGSLVADNGKRLASKAQVAILKKGDAERVANMMAFYKVQRLEDLTVTQASQAIEQLKKPVKTEGESC